MPPLTFRRSLRDLAAGMLLGAALGVMPLVRRWGYPTKLATVLTLVDWILTLILYLLATATGFMAVVLLVMVIVPLLSYWGAANDHEGTSHQPRDEESLAATDSDGGRPLSLAERWKILVWFLLIFGMAFVVAFILQPIVHPLIMYQRALQLMSKSLKYAGTGGAALLILPSIPLLIFWAIIERVSVEPYRTSYARRKRLATRATGGVFLYLLALECVSFYPPLRSAPFLQRLVWQAVPLSRVGKWFGLCVYGASVLWTCTDRGAGYLIYRGARKLGAKLTPSPETGWFRYICEFILLPAAMVYNGDVYAVAHPISMYSSRNSIISTGLSYGFATANRSAPVLIAWTTLAVVAALLLDLLVYWLYFVWVGWNAVVDENWRSPLDVMSISMFAYCVHEAKKALVKAAVKHAKSNGAEKPELVEGSISKDMDKGLLKSPV
ncbi:hypothetical protein B0H19DRAFT_1171076 [Mycena capillaripes]|nr:hypothetical protein B0H19DRAFT_1171076 [Mycena capillaripes]